MANVNEDQVRGAHKAMSECLAASHAFKETLQQVWHARQLKGRDADLSERAEHDRNLKRLRKAYNDGVKALKPVAQRLSAWVATPVRIDEAWGASYHEVMLSLAGWLLDRDWTSESLTAGRSRVEAEVSRFLCVSWDETGQYEVRLRIERDRLLEGATGVYDGILWELPDRPRQLLRLLVLHEGEMVPNEEVHDELWPRLGYDGVRISQLVARLKEALRERAPELMNRIHRVRGGTILE